MIRHVNIQHVAFRANPSKITKSHASIYNIPQAAAMAWHVEIRGWGGWGVFILVSYTLLQPGHSESQHQLEM